MNSANVFTGSVNDATQSFIGFGNMQGMPVRLGINRNGFYAHALKRAGNAARNRTAIGNQDLFEHQRVPLSQITASMGVGL